MFTLMINFSQTALEFVSSVLKLKLMRVECNPGIYATANDVGKKSIHVKNR